MTPMDRLTQAVDELVAPRLHREALQPDMAPIDVRTRRPIHGAIERHIPSLLVQLKQAVEPSGSAEAGHRVPASQPAARIEAMDVLLEIDTESTMVTTWLGGTVRSTLSATVRGLVGLVAGLEAHDPNLREIASYATAWRTRAAVVTGWEVPARCLDNTCPLCAARGSLRVRVDVNTGSGTGFCVQCREAWDEQTIGLLAQHIRIENREDELEEIA